MFACGTDRSRESYVVRVPLVFGYGSLVPAAAGGQRATLSGWRRIWGVAMDNTEDIPGYKHFVDPGTGERPAVWVAFVDLEAAPEDEVTGAVLEVADEDLPTLDARERNYARALLTTSAGPAWTYLGSPAGRERLRLGRAAGRCVVADEYLASVRAGFAALAPDGPDRFTGETGPLPGPIRSLRVVPHPVGRGREHHAE